MITKAVKTRTFLEGEDLFSFVVFHIKKVPENSVVVITSKIVALSEKRTAAVGDKKEKEKLIQTESSLAIETKHVWLTIKDGMVLPSAGIDESNANGKYILLPQNSFQSASDIRNKLKEYYGVENLGVIIVDSGIIPLRSGVIGLAIGYAGFRGLKDYRGKLDMFGRKLDFSATDVADSLATAAVLVMGEANEKQPLALIKNAPIEFCEHVDQGELHIDVEDDMFGPLFEKFL